MYREPDESFENLHIVSPCLASKCQFATNDEKYRFVTGTAGVLGIIPKDDSRMHCLYLLGVLNSSVTEFFIKRRSPRFAGGFYKFTAPYLKELPLPPIDSAMKEHNSIAKHAETVLEALQELPKAKSTLARTTFERTIEAGQRKIDEIIFASYGLSAEDASVIGEVLAADSLPDAESKQMDTDTEDATPTKRIQAKLALE
jgi:hypothetical protein